MSAPHSYRTEPLWLRLLLWVIAVILMFAAVAYQRSTGPTYPRKGSFTAGGQRYAYALVRSDASVKTNPAAPVMLPDPGPQATGTLFWKRYRTADAFTAVPLAHEMARPRRGLLRLFGDLLRGRGKPPEQPFLIGRLPAQPAAGKLEYYLELEAGEGPQRIPALGETNVVIRFKDSVPAGILIPHILMMFFSVLIGMRTGLAAVFAPSSMRRYSWLALVGMTIGGMVLGPFVQKFAFGEFWTGFPKGGDFTDNKMLFMWLSWVFACAVIGFKPKRKELIPRGAVVLAALVMSAVYLIPHSMGGSELDYGAVEQGVNPADAIRTGEAVSAAQLHLLVVHLPVLACPAAVVLLLCARRARNETLFQTGAAFLVLGALGAAVAYFSGPPAYESLNLPVGVERDLAEVHGALGKGAFMGLVLAGLAAVLALLQYAQGEQPTPWLRWALLVAALLLTWLLAWTAHQGGLIRHPELRALPSPLFPNL